MTTSIKPSRNGVRQLTENPNRAERQPSKAITSSIPAPTSVKGDSVVNKRKGLLPQRSISIKGRRDGVEQPQEPGGGVQPQHGRPPQLEGPGAKLPTRSMPSQAPTDRVISRPTSPSKSESKRIPGSPTKPQMLPTSRPLRSASLRQPSTPKVFSSSAAKGHARHRSQVSGAAPVSLAGGYGSRQPDGTSSAAAARATRPQFSTFQQHFSPKKKLEEPRPVLGVAPLEKPNKELTAASRLDVAALQTEYLQLYLLRSSTAQKDFEWRTTSERSLRKQYDSVTKAYRGLLAQDKQAQTIVNIAALHQWSGNIGTRESRDDFASQLQTLSRIIQEATDFSEPPGGRYLLLVTIFERWMRTVKLIRESRGRLSTHDVRSEAPAFISPLEQAWKDELKALNTKVELCLRELQSLDIICKLRGHERSTDSALFRIVNGHKSILAMMFDEMKVMRTIEAEVVSMERSWTSHAADQLQSVDDQSRVRNTSRGVWLQS